MSLHLQCSCVARCRPEHVWERFRDVHTWPWWNQVIGRARWLVGVPWQEGSRMELEIVRPARVKSELTVRQCSPPTLVYWTLGGFAEHRFRFELQEDGTTRLQAEQTLRGLRAIFFSSRWRRNGEQALQWWLEALKLEAEKLAREQAARS